MRIRSLARRSRERHSSSALRAGSGAAPTAAHRCPICDSAPALDDGRVRHRQPTRIAGVPVELGDTEFRLFRCAVCGFRFKRPLLPPALLADAYRRSSEANWELSPDPRVRKFDLICDTIARSHRPGTGDRRPRILDIGCSNGALLAFLGEGYDRCGVEPSHRAARVASERGVRILGESMGDIDEASRFDVLLAIDVVEHLAEPLAFFAGAARLLERGGVFLILTGDTESRTWRLQGSDHWYCSLAEHLSFFSRPTLDWIADHVGLEVASCVRVSHMRSTFPFWLRETSKNLAWLAGRALGWVPGETLRSKILERHAPFWASSRDHMLCVLRRPLPFDRRPFPSLPRSG